MAKHVGRFPIEIAASVTAHAVILYVLLAVPAGQRLVQRIVPVQLIERPKPPPPKVRRPPPPKARAAARARPASQPRPAPAEAADANAGDGFGIAPDDGGAGTMEVPVGRTLEVPAVAGPPGPAPTPAPLVLAFEDDGKKNPIQREPAPIGPLRALYPEIPRLAGATGSAVVEAFVDAAGLVSRAVLAAASAPAFGKAALDAVRQTRFSPAIRMGIPVARSIRVPVLFELAGGIATVVTATVSASADGGGAAVGAGLAAPFPENVPATGGIMPTPPAAPGMIPAAPASGTIPALPAPGTNLGVPAPVLPTVGLPDHASGAATP